jgi:hypothetical protein
MRSRRQDPAELPTPAPCAHAIVTWQGESAPACMWGRGEPWPPFPGDAYGTPEGDAMEAAHREHFYYVNLKSVPRAELLDPFGNQVERRPFEETLPERP